MFNKQHYQKYFGVNNYNITHVIHIAPKYSEWRMKKIFYRVNWELCKTFLPNHFPNFKDSGDRFNFYCFPQFKNRHAIDWKDKGFHFHLLVHSPQRITKKMVGNCICFNSLNTCEKCVTRRLKELFLETDKSFRFNKTEKYWDENEVKQTRVLNEGNIQINEIYDNTYDATQQIYATRDFSKNVEGIKEDEFFVIPEHLSKTVDRDLQINF